MQGRPPGMSMPMSVPTMLLSVLVLQQVGPVKQIDQPLLRLLLPLPKLMSFLLLSHLTLLQEGLVLLLGQL